MPLNIKYAHFNYNKRHANYIVFCINLSKIQNLMITSVDNSGWKQTLLHCLF